MRSSAMTATAPASWATTACSGVTTSMMTPPLSICARPRLTVTVPVLFHVSIVSARVPIRTFGHGALATSGGARSGCSAERSYGAGRVGDGSLDGRGASASGCCRQIGMFGLVESASPERQSASAWPWRRQGVGIGCGGTRGSGKRGSRAADRVSERFQFGTVGLRSTRSGTGVTTIGDRTAARSVACPRTRSPMRSPMRDRRAASTTARRPGRWSAKRLRRIEHGAY